MPEIAPAAAKLLELAEGVEGFRVGSFDAVDNAMLTPIETDDDQDPVEIGNARGALPAPGIVRVAPTVASTTPTAHSTVDARAGPARIPLSSQ